MFPLSPFSSSARICISIGRRCRRAGAGAGAGADPIPKRMRDPRMILRQQCKQRGGRSAREIVQFVKGQWTEQDEEERREEGGIW